jgi:hypothetical protein
LSVEGRGKRFSGGVGSNSFADGSGNGGGSSNAKNTRPVSAHDAERDAADVEAVQLHQRLCG